MSDLGVLLAVKARYDRLTGRYAEGTDACLALLKFGCLIRADAENIPSYDQGEYIMLMGLTQILDFVCDSRVPPAELRRLAAGLDGIGSLAPDLIRAAKILHASHVKTLDQLRDGKLRVNEIIGGNTPFILQGKWMPAYCFQPNKTKCLVANYTHYVISNAPNNYLAMGYLPDGSLYYRSEEYFRCFQLNYVGRVFFKRTIVGHLLLQKCLFECEVAATRLLVAIRRYRDDTGRLPADLKDLTPKYIAEVPQDPFDGQPFRYSPAKGVIYSVGLDFNDAGGSWRGKSEWSHGTNALTKSEMRNYRLYSEDIVYEIDEPKTEPK
jgi:hypothetical protein